MKYVGWDVKIWDSVQTVWFSSGEIWDGFHRKKVPNYRQHFDWAFHFPEFSTTRSYFFHLSWLTWAYVHISVIFLMKKKNSTKAVFTPTTCPLFILGPPPPHKDGSLNGIQPNSRIIAFHHSVLLPRPPPPRFRLNPHKANWWNIEIRELRGANRPQASREGTV